MQAELNRKDQRLLFNKTDRCTPLTRTSFRQISRFALRAREPSKPEQPVEASFQGLKVVAEGEEPVIEQVVSHRANGVHWLHDLLPADIVKARIFCWGYDANTYGDRVSCQYLYDHARSLVSDLCLERRLTNTTRRPIIFVAHSLGGIIVKSALIHSDAARKGALEEHRSIKTSTYGIMFMGTPHQGSGSALMGKLLVNVASVFVTADDRLLKHLEDNSEWLQQQLGQYGSISGDFVTKFAYEVYKTPTIMRYSILVVPRESAVVPGAVDAEPIAIHADHLNMVRFMSKEHNGYRTVSGHLRIMAESACNVIASRWEEEERINTARINSDEKFSVVFSLSEVIETNHFVARQEELTTMHKTLGGGTARRAVTLHGLGGIGKTQLAIAYAKTYSSNYSAVLWLNIKDEDSVKQSYARIARRILQEHPSTSQLVSITDESQLDEIVIAVKRWLEHAKNTQWLMVFDNYDNPKVPGNVDPGVVNIQQYLPEAYHGSVIVTTRDSKVNVGRRMKVDKLGNIYDSLQILSETSHRDGVMDDPDAAELAKELDGLPLALATAGAYLDQVATSFADYFRLYKTSWLKLQQTSPELSSYEERQLYSTWQLSYDQIRQQNKLSAQLLQLWAYFDNQDLWFELLRELSSCGPEWLRQLKVDELSFTQAVRVLCDYGLAEVDRSSEASEVESKGYGIHSCVHSWTISVLNQEWNPETAGLVLECIGLHIPDENTHKPWVARRRLIRHAARCAGFVLNGTAKNKGREWALHTLGLIFSEVGRLNEAEIIYQRALQGYEKTLGPDHISTLGTVNNLGVLYTDLGRLDEAEIMCQRALQGREQALGPDHILTLDTVHNLGNLYRDLGRLDEAEIMYQRALQGYEKVLGPNHILTLGTVNNLGALYRDLGRLDEAEIMYQRALQGREKALGPDHISILNTVNNLGVLYTDLGRLDEAEIIYQRALQGREQALGPNHILTLDTVHNLGNLYRDLGRFNEAEIMYQRALQGYEKALGPDHISALDTVDNLGALYRHLGRLDEAEIMYQRAVRLRESQRS
ncbi:MAG: hypothetical protein Q9163_001675 [Psora crenata]